MKTSSISLHITSFAIGSLDYERQILHQLKVLAVDRAKQGRVNTGTATLLVKVQDVEDQPPEFVKIQPVARVSEDAPVGTSILQGLTSTHITKPSNSKHFAVTAVDGDRGINNPIEYSLASNSIGKESELFKVDKNTGIVKTTNTLDRETLSPNSGAYILQITATEVGGNILPRPSAVTEVTIIITDVNDEAPTFRNRHYLCEVPENAAINTPITFLGNSIPEVFDYDQGNNGTFQLFLFGANDTFEVTPSQVINEATFMIRVKNSTILDYEQVQVLNFTLVAKETTKYNPKASTAGVTVQILDRNDNYPEFTKKSYEVSVPENCEVGTTVAWVQALDEDSGIFGTKGVRYTNLAGSIENL